jgi:hypothetical protein
MHDIRKRLVAVISGLVLSFALAACDAGDDDPSTTTAPGETETTSPVGS